MESHSGRHVAIKICMMHHVKAPQNGHSMEEHMLEVEREIQGASSGVIRG